VGCKLVTAPRVGHDEWPVRAADSLVQRLRDRHHVAQAEERERRVAGGGQLHGPQR
jgi:hypothetical protein